MQDKNFRLDISPVRLCKSFQHNPVRFLILINSDLIPNLTLQSLPYDCLEFIVRTFIKNIIRHQGNQAFHRYVILLDWDNRLRGADHSCIKIFISPYISRITFGPDQRSFQPVHQLITGAVAEVQVSEAPELSHQSGNQQNGSGQQPIEKNGKT